MEDYPHERLPLSETTFLMQEHALYFMQNKPQTKEYHFFTHIKLKHMWFCDGKCYISVAGNRSMTKSPSVFVATARATSFKLYMVATCWALIIHTSCEDFDLLLSHRGIWKSFFFFFFLISNVSYQLIMNYSSCWFLGRSLVRGLTVWLWHLNWSFSCNKYDTDLVHGSRHHAEQLDRKERQPVISHRLLGCGHLLWDQRAGRGLQQGHTGSRMHVQTGAPQLVSVRPVLPQRARVKVQVDPSIPQILIIVKLVWQNFLILTDNSWKANMKDTVWKCSRCNRNCHFCVNFSASAATTVQPELSRTQIG